MSKSDIGNTSYWKVLHNPDEIGLLTDVTYIKTTWNGIDSISYVDRLESLQLSDYCYRTYGRKVIYVSDGYLPKRNWELHKITDGEYEQANASNHPSSKTTPYKHHFNIGFKNGGMSLAK